MGLYNNLLRFSSAYRTFRDRSDRYDEKQKKKRINKYIAKQKRASSKYRKKRLK